MNRKAEIANARKVDTEVARLWGEFHKVNDQIKPIMDSIARSERTLKARGTRDFERERISARIETNKTRIAAIREEAAPLKEAAQTFDRENYKGWTRFFMVQHIHNSMNCSSFRPTTRVGWLPDVSGLTEAEAVAEHGATLCTICFPSAPVELTVPKVDESICVGSGQPIDKTKLTGRERSHYSPTGTCSACGKTVGLTARFSGKVRKHKK